MYKDAIRALEDAQQFLLPRGHILCFITSKVTKAVYPWSTHHFITHIISLPFISMTHVVCIEIIIIRALYGRTSEEGTTFKQWTKCWSPSCPLLRGSTVLISLQFMTDHRHGSDTHIRWICMFTYMYMYLGNSHQVVTSCLPGSPYFYWEWLNMELPLKLGLVGGKCEGTAGSSKVLFCSRQKGHWRLYHHWVRAPKEWVGIPAYNYTNVHSTSTYVHD